jgi:hypothetical protein
MVMRYHWGHAVGHVYAHDGQSPSQGSDTPHGAGELVDAERPPSVTMEEQGNGSNSGPQPEGDGNVSDKDDDDNVSRSSGDSNYLLSMEEMYGETDTGDFMTTYD